MKKYKAQGLIEFAIVIPILLIVLLGIIEFSLYWRDTQTVQQIAYEAGILASREYVDPAVTTNAAVDKAVALVKGRVKNLGVNTDLTQASVQGDEPYGAYVYNSTSTNSSGEPIVMFTVDYRNPVQRGVITQLTYRHRSITGGVAFTLPGGRTFTIVPREIPIISSKIQQYQVY